MGNFLFGLFSCVTLFAFSYLLSVLINRFMPEKKIKQPKKKTEDVYYIAGVGEIPKKQKKKGVAIRGELLKKSEFERVLKGEER